MTNRALGMLLGAAVLEFVIKCWFQLWEVDIYMVRWVALGLAAGVAARMLRLPLVLALLAGELALLYYLGNQLKWTLFLGSSQLFIVLLVMSGRE